MYSVVFEKLPEAVVTPYNFESMRKYLSKNSRKEGLAFALALVGFRNISDKSVVKSPKAILADIHHINSLFMLTITFEASYSMVIKYPSLV